MFIFTDNKNDCGKGGFIYKGRPAGRVRRRNLPLFFKKASENLLFLMDSNLNEIHLKKI